MTRIRPTADIQPLSAFRMQVAAFVDQVRDTGRPLILTQHGKSAAVLLSAHEYEALMDELDLRRQIEEAELAPEAGATGSVEDVLEKLRARALELSG